MCYRKREKPSCDEPHLSGEGTACESRTECAAGLVCHGVTDRCQAPGDFDSECDRDSDCRQGLACGSGKRCAAPRLETALPA